MKDALRSGNMNNNTQKKEVVMAETEDEIETETEDLSGREVMDKYLSDNKIHNFDMSNGIKALNTISSDLGYREQGYKYGSSFEVFLQDNPDCVEKIFDWIAERLDRSTEWKESLMVEDEPEQDGN
jgi:hypothetical protein